MKRKMIVILLVLILIGLVSCVKEEESPQPCALVRLYELSEDIYCITQETAFLEKSCTLYLVVTDEFVSEGNLEEYANKTYEIWSNYSSLDYYDLKVVFVTENCHEEPNYEILYETVFS